MAAPKPVVKMEIHPTYYTEDGYEIKFIPMGRTTPGFSHKVIIMRDGVRIAKDWSATQFAPSVSSATFYYNKHVRHAMPEDAEYWQGRAAIFEEKRLRGA